MSTSSTVSLAEKPKGINGVDSVGRPTVTTPAGVTFVQAKNGNWVDSSRMRAKGNGGASTSAKFANPDKVAPSKVADYIRRVHIDGIARSTAYEECVDPRAKEIKLAQRYTYINRLESRPDYENLKQFIMEEDQKDMILRSQTVRNKALELLMSTLESAHKGVIENADDPKMLSAASGVLKSLTPILTAVQGPQEEEPKKLDNSDRLKLRASRVVG